MTAFFVSTVQTNQSRQDTKERRNIGKFWH